jgi:hypothetical protein
MTVAGTTGVEGKMEAKTRHQALVAIQLTAEETAQLEYAASYAGQGPLGSVDPTLLRRLERWARRGQPIRARLDRATLEALLALAPLFTAYREHRRETETLYCRDPGGQAADRAAAA